MKLDAFRKSWYNKSQEINSYVKLRLDDDDFDQSFSLLKSYIEQILQVEQIDYLRITNICNDTLIKILSLIPKLDSLRISSLIIIQNDVIDKYQNQITKVTLQEMMNMKQIDFLLEFFPQMNYLRIGCTNNIDIQVFFRHIINKMNTISNHQLRSIRFSCFSLLMIR